MSSSLPEQKPSRIENREGKLVRVTVQEELVEPIEIVDQVADVIARVVRDFKRELFQPETYVQHVEVEFANRIAAELYSRGLLKDETPIAAPEATEAAGGV